MGNKDEQKQKHGKVFLGALSRLEELASSDPLPWAACAKQTIKKVNSGPAVIIFGLRCHNAQFLFFFSTGLRQNKQTFNPTDTNALVAAVAFGKGLSNRRPPGSGGSVQSGQPGAGAIIAGASGMQQVPMSSAPAQQQPMLAGVQMAQAGQPGKYVAYLTVTENQEARKLNADVEILLQSLFKYSRVRGSFLSLRI